MVSSKNGSSPLVTVSHEDMKPNGGLQPHRKFNSALKIALIYFVFSSVWIYFSDQALKALITDPGVLLQWSVFKGWGFIIVTSVMLFFLIQRALAGAARANQKAHLIEQAARSEQLFSEAMIESMPGVMYFYDDQGRFVRWNKNFERVSGYSPIELREMHPLDFFHPDEKGLVEARIEEVFRKGESSVEARFLTRDGRLIPYFFTGQRLVFEGKECLVGIGIDLSERKMAEEALRKSETRYRTTLDNILEGCQLLAFDWTYLYLNTAAAAHNRRPNADLIGKTMLEAWPGIETTDIYRRLHECMTNRTAFHDEVQFHFLDGETGWFDVRAQAVPEGMFVLSIDITDRHHAEMALRESELKYRELVENAKTIILRWTNDGRLVFVNKFGRTFFDGGDEPKNEIFGWLLPDKTEKHQALRELLNRIATGLGSLEQEIKGENGDSVWVAWTHRVVSQTGNEATEILSVGTDITARRKAELAVRELNASLEKRVDERTTELEVQRDRAEAGDRLKSAFLATMSHELRTPLNSIIGFTGIIIQELPGPLNAEQKKQLGMVRGSARHLLELINDVLDISKIEAGELEVKGEPFELRASVEQAVATVRPLAERKGLWLELKMPFRSLMVNSDRRRVEQILLNLLNNAVKFTESGGITLSVSYAASPYEPGESIHKPPGEISLSVEDTGIGIAPEALAMLFQPFRQIDSGISRKHEGTGLGLAICRKLAHLLGGEVSVTSELHKGSIFRVKLPDRIHHESNRIADRR